MFSGASAFTRDISSWNTDKLEYRKVTDMSDMFQNTVAFDRNIGSWNTANVTNMYGMFDGAAAFNQDIGSWNTANVTTMERNVSEYSCGLTAISQLEYRKT
ncbi:hypothetical protein FQR65_LT17215 [Abscondita terminalis]|nr:hypothetical protein FQR65_LT17215 [Abscondita terminalis]